MNRSTGMLLGAVVAAAVLSGCGPDGQPSPAAAAREEAAVRTVNVEVQTIEPAPFTEFVRVVGTLEAEHDVTVSAEEGGVIREFYVEKGDRVDAGQPIAKIDDSLLAAQYRQAKAQAALAKEQADRQRRLWEEQQVGSEMAYLQAKYGAESAEASADVLRARLERTVIRAPIAGVLDARMAEVGETVGAGAPVARVVDADSVKAVAGVPERYASDVGSDTQAQVLLDALGGRTFSGAIRFVGQTVSEQSRTFPVEVVVPNPGRMIKPGMVADIRIARRDIEEAVLVPQEAVLRTEDGYIAYVVEERDGRQVVMVRPVETGATRGDQVVIEAGLEAGDRIVVVGQQKVAQGDVVTVVERTAGQENAAEQGPEA